MIGTFRAVIFQGLEKSQTIGKPPQCGKYGFKVPGNHGG